MNIDRHAVIRAAGAFSAADLLAALCHQALDATTGEVADLLHDPNFAADEGIPSKASMIERAHDWITDTIPYLLAEELSDKYVKNENETMLEFVIRSIMAEYVENNPNVIALTIHPR